MLEHIKCVLSNKFKEKRTYFERNKEEREQIRKDTKEAIKNAEEAMQAREEFKQKAELADQVTEQALIGTASSCMRIAGLGGNKAEMYQVHLEILRNLIFLYKKNAMDCDESIYKAREEVYRIYREARNILEEAVNMDSKVKMENLLKVSNAIKSNLKQLQGDGDKNLEQEVIIAIEQREAQRKAQEKEGFKQKAAQEAQARKEAERAEQRLKVTRLFFKLLGRPDFDKELRKTVEESDDVIVEAVAKYVMEHNSSPELLLNEMMGEIGRNKAKILSAEDATEAINEVIEDAVRRFIASQVVSKMVEKVEEQETLRKRVIDLMHDGADAFGIPIEEIMQNQDMMENLEQLYIYLVLNMDYQEKYRDVSDEYKKLGEELKNVNPIGRKEYDKVSKLTDQFDELNKSFTECEYNAEKFTYQRSDTKNINELISSIIGEIEKANTCVKQERQILLKEKSIVEEMVQERQQSNPSSSISDVNVPGTSHKLH